MAIIKIESLAPRDKEIIPKMLLNITNEISRKMDWSGKGLRVYFSQIEKGAYAFGGEIGEEVLNDKFPPVVHLYVQEKREKKAVDVIVRTTAEEVGKAFGISPENVYVLVNKYGKDEMFMYGKYI